MKNFMLGLLSGGILGFALCVFGVYVDFNTAPEETAKAFKALAK